MHDLLEPAESAEPPRPVEEAETTEPAAIAEPVAPSQEAAPHATSGETVLHAPANRETRPTPAEPQGVSGRSSVGSAEFDAILIPTDPDARREYERELVARLHAQHAPESAKVPSIWRSARWALLAVILLAVSYELAVNFERSMETAKIGTLGSAAVASDVSTAGATPAQPGQRVLVVQPGLNLRTQPSRAAGVIIRKLTKGMKLTLLATKPGWYNVKAPDGTAGWVIQSFSGQVYSQLVAP